MKIAVHGLWHLGSVTAACLAAAGYEVIGFDQDENTIRQLQAGKAPLFEPGLDSLIQQGQAKNCLRFSSNKNEINKAEYIWITIDTPVDDNDIADIDFVTHQVEAIFPYIQNNAIFLISSQVPVGTTRKLSQRFREQCPQTKVTFACLPENLRLGKAIDVFTNPDRIIVGLEDEHDRERIKNLLAPFSQNIVWMSLESAEMTKHALNAFLATSVVFINELSTLCEKVGADARDVERGLKTEERIGPKAYLRPGNPIAGGTLARDVNYLIQTGQTNKTTTPLFSALLDSNQAHKQWACQRVTSVLKDLKNKTIATLGLTYKSGTDTLRRSTAVETCEWFSQQGAQVVAYDPSIKQLPKELGKFINLKSSLGDAISNADAVVVSTEWPEFHSLMSDEFVLKTKNPIVFDAGGFLAKNLSHDSRIRYFSVGKQA